MAENDAHDWEIIARRDPYFGVLSNPVFRADAITPEYRRQFYASGDEDIGRLLGWFDEDVGARPSSGRALDIGCGVGRLAQAMAKHVAAVVGYDVAESMLALARAEAPANAEFSTMLPQGPFGWINSYIVFQHIPPSEGLKLIEDALAQAAPGCFLSLHITFWRDHARPGTGLLSRLRRHMIRSAGRKPAGDAAQLVRMYDYNMSEVMRRITAAGFNRVVTRHTDHAGHHGLWLIARRGES